MAVAVAMTLAVAIGVAVAIGMTISIGMPIATALPGPGDAHSPGKHLAVFAVAAADEQLRHDIKPHAQRASQHLVGRILDGFCEVPQNPFADEIIGYGDFQLILL